MAEKQLSPTRERQRRYERTHRHRENARRVRWRKDLPAATHGKTRAQIYATLEAQGCVCAICKTATHGGAVVGKEGRLGQGWHGDHDHKTGLFRGVLCRQCNLGLGHFRDSIKVMYEAVRYLEKHKAFAKLL